MWTFQESVLFGFACMAWWKSMALGVLGVRLTLPFTNIVALSSFH